MVQSLSRGLGILSQFTAESRSLSLPDLARRTGLHRATAYRFIRTLEVEGFVTYDPDSALYSVGPAWAAALYSLGSETALTEILNSDMQALSEALSETCTLSVRRGDQVQIINVIDSSRLFRPRLPNSSLVALNEFWNVNSKIHLAFASEDTRRRMLAIPAVRYTQNTLTDRKAIAACLDRVATDRVACDCEEHDLEVCAIAVPVFEKGNVALALGVVTPVDRFGRERCQTVQARAGCGRRGDGSPAGKGRVRLEGSRSQIGGPSHARDQTGGKRAVMAIPY